MATAMEKIETVQQFVDLVLQTKIFGAKEWFEEFRKGMPPVFWESYLKAPITEEVVAEIGYEVSHYVTVKLINVSRNGHAFLREIHKLAVSAGLEIELNHVDRIFEPLPPRPAKAKK